MVHRAICQLKGIDIVRTRWVCGFNAVSLCYLCFNAVQESGQNIGDCVLRRNVSPTRGRRLNAKDRGISCGVVCCSALCKQSCPTDPGCFQLYDSVISHATRRDSFFRASIRIVLAAVDLLKGPSPPAPGPRPVLNPCRFPRCGIAADSTSFR